MGTGGEIFVLDMGEPVRILGMAKDMIRLFGLKPYEDIDIEFSGMRPGEKLFEKLELTGEGITQTGHQKIFIGSLNGADPSKVSPALERLRELAREGDADVIRGHLGDLLPEARLGMT